MVSFFICLCKICWLFLFNQKYIEFNKTTQKNYKKYLKSYYHSSVIIDKIELSLTIVSIKAFQVFPTCWGPHLTQHSSAFQPATRSTSFSVRKPLRLEVSLLNIHRICLVMFRGWLVLGKRCLRFKTRGYPSNLPSNWPRKYGVANSDWIS